VYPVIKRVSSSERSENERKYYVLSLPPHFNEQAGLIARVIIQMPKGARVSAERYSDIEQRVRRVGLELQACMKKEVPSFFEKKRWIGRTMERVMRDEEFKVRLFRFVDVLPALKSDDLVVSILKEYFSVADVDAPSIIKHGMERLSRGRVPSFVAAKIARSAVRALARQFIAGSDPAGSAKAVESLSREGVELRISETGMSSFWAIYATGGPERPERRPRRVLFPSAFL
jgi:hypothetical protein